MSPLLGTSQRLSRQAEPLQTDGATLSHTFNYLPGDINLDGSVNVSDLAVLAANYRHTVTGTPAQLWAQGDFSGDGVVNISDLAILAANYRHTGSDLSLDQAEAMYGLPLTRASAGAVEVS